MAFGWISLTTAFRLGRQEAVDLMRAGYPIAGYASSDQRSRRDRRHRDQHIERDGACEFRVGAARPRKSSTFE